MTNLNDQTAVLLDHHPLWLDAVEEVLRRIGVRVTGKATAPQDALRLLETSPPDLFVTELYDADEGLDGPALVRRAREVAPALRCIVLSMRDDGDSIDAAFDAGASAYVLKTAHADDFAAAIRQTFGSSVYLPGRRDVPAVSRPRHFTDESLKLTRREIEILQLVAEGHSNAQLAKMLWVTEQTVKFHLSNIYRKLEVSNRTEASRWAQVNGLLAAPQLSVA